MENEELVVNDYEEEVEDIGDEEEEETGSFATGTIVGVAIGSGLTLGGIALFKKLKTVMAQRRWKKKLETDKSSEVLDVEVEEVDDQSEPEEKSKKK